MKVTNLEINKIENALGFSLYPWVEETLITGCSKSFPAGRRIGKTTCSILCELLTDIRFGDIDEIKYPNVKRLRKSEKEKIKQKLINCDLLVSDRIQDNVNKPNHYLGNIETIDYIKDKLTQDQFVGYCIGNVIKYISRFQKKNGKEDLQKAQVYLNWAIENYTTNVDDDNVFLSTPKSEKGNGL